MNLGSVAGKWCAEERRDMCGGSGKVVQAVLDVGLQLCLTARRLLRAGDSLDIAVEQFVRIVLRRIGREEKQLNLCFVLI